jgi:hypothetical protein
MKTKEEIEQLAEKYAEGYRCPATNENEYCKHDIISAYNNGYTQCQEDMADEILDELEKFTIEYEKSMADKKYTEEDIREAIDMARMLSHVSCLEDGEHRLKYSNTEEDIINSLNKQDNDK